MAAINLLYASEYAITDQVKIQIPTVGEVLDHEDAYYTLVSLLTAMPYDMMVLLDDAGIDFTKINDYELFLLLFGELKKADTSLIFGDLDLSGFRMMASQDSSMVFLQNDDGVVIDRRVQSQIASTLRTIHHLEKNRRKPANDAAKGYLLQRAREKQKRKKRAVISQLERYIVALVNAEQYKYNFLETRELTIYQFNESLHQIIHKVEFDNRMFGVYMGTVKASELSQDDLNWLIHK